MHPRNHPGAQKLKLTSPEEFKKVFEADNLHQQRQDGKVIRKADDSVVEQKVHCQRVEGNPADGVVAGSVGFWTQVGVRQCVVDSTGHRQSLHNPGN